MKKITIVSRHYPPNKNVNGILANEMARYLIQHYGAEVTIVCIDRDADGNQSPVEPFGRVVRVKPLSGKQNGFAKLFNLIYDGYSLIRRAQKHPSDLIICTTSPPLLPFWAATLFGKRTAWALWSLDLFPEGFVAAGTWKENSWLYKTLLRRTYKKAPDLLISLGEEQARHIREKYRAEIPTIILPAGVALETTEATKAIEQPAWYQSDKLVLGYFGNVGQAHNPEFIKQAIVGSSEKNMLFVLAVYGIHADEVKAYAAKFQHTVIIENGLPKEHLPFIDIHLVSLRTNWTHIAVPSKAVTAISSGRPILFCGSEHSDNWQMFREAGWLIDEQQDLQTQIEQFIASIDPAGVQEKAAHTQEILTQLKQQVLDAYKAIAVYDRPQV